jgi:glucosamine--fructose-6-phosphate aminotransferase (isomerizing)
MHATPQDSRYLCDILGQAEALRRALAQRPDDGVAKLVAQRGRGRIVLTGMGASLAAVQPAWLRLAQAGWPAWRLETATLLHDAPHLLTHDSLVIAVSQSGRSAELVALAERSAPAGPAIVAVTNDPRSPLAERAEVVLDVHAGDEHAVSTRSYLNTVATLALAVDAIVGGDSEAALAGAADAIDEYLSTWRARVDALSARIGLPARLFILARGDSLAAAEYGALIVKEAAKWPAEALSAGQFRHGPLELADDRLLAIVLAGERSDDRSRNARLVADLTRFGARALWADSDPDADVAGLRIPRAHGAGLVLAQAVALQLLSVAIAEQTGVEAGAFRHLEKVTTVE